MYGKMMPGEEEGEKIVYNFTVQNKDTNRKIRKPEFIYICGSKNGSSSSAVNLGEV